MRTIFFLFIALLINSNQSKSQGWECQECPKRDLALFDLNVWQREPPPPGSGLDQADWLQMFMVAGGIFDALFNDDPSRECINFFFSNFCSSKII